MKNHYNPLLVVCAIVVFFVGTNSSNAQRIYRTNAGIDATFCEFIYTADLPALYNATNFTQYSTTKTHSMSGEGYAFGASLRYQLDKNENVGDLNIRLEYIGGKMSSAIADNAQKQVNNNGTISTVSFATEWRSEIDVSMANLHVLYSLPLFGTKFHVQAGASVGYMFTPKLNSTYSTTESGATFKEGVSSFTIANNDITSYNSTRTGLVAGISYETSGAFVIVPHVEIDYSLSQFLQNVSGTQHILRGGVEFRLALDR